MCKQFCTHTWGRIQKCEEGWIGITFLMCWRLGEIIYNNLDLKKMGEKNKIRYAWVHTAEVGRGQLVRPKEQRLAQSHLERLQKLLWKEPCGNGGMQECVPGVSLHMVWFHTGLSGAHEIEGTFESVVAGVRGKPWTSLNSILWKTSSCIRTILHMVLVRAFPLVLLWRKDNLGHHAMLITGRVTHTCCAKMYL